jgi:toxin ParE1/3/4
MTFRVSVRPAAEADLREAYDWYELRESKLGSKFLHQIDNCLKKIALHPEMYPAVHKNVRQAVVGRFPYCVMYLTGDAITVVAVFHAARDPKIWKRRI